MNVELWLVMLCVGIIVKTIDDIYDLGTADRWVGLLLSLLSIPLGLYVLLDVEGFILLGPIFFTTVIRGKIDNRGFGVGFLMTVVLWALLYWYYRPFMFDLALGASFMMGIMSIFVTTYLHEWKPEKTNVLVEVLLEERYLMVLLVVPALLFELITLSGIFGFFLMNTGYLLAKRISINETHIDTTGQDALDAGD